MKYLEDWPKCRLMTLMNMRQHKSNQRVFRLLRLCLLGRILIRILKIFTRECTYNNFFLYFRSRLSDKKRKSSNLPGHLLGAFLYGGGISCLVWTQNIRLHLTLSWQVDHKVFTWGHEDFLVACTRLYTPHCPSVGWSVGPSHFYFFYQFYFFKSF